MGRGEEFDTIRRVMSIKYLHFSKRWLAGGALDRVRRLFFKPLDINPSVIHILKSRFDLYIIFILSKLILRRSRLALVIFIKIFESINL